LVFLLFLTATRLPPTREQVAADAQSILRKCGAEGLISIVVVDSQTFEIVSIKDVNKQTAADRQALICVGRQWTRAIDFRPLAELLTVKAP